MYLDNISICIKLLMIINISIINDAINQTDKKLIGLSSFDFMCMWYSDNDLGTIEEVPTKFEFLFSKLRNKRIRVCYLCIE